MIKGSDKQAAPLAKVLGEIAESEETFGFEISQDQFRRVRPSTITVFHHNRSGKCFRIDKIRPDGEHAKGEP